MDFLSLLPAASRRPGWSGRLFERGSRKCALGVFAVLSKLIPRELGFWVKLIFFVWLIFEKGFKCVIAAVFGLIELLEN